MLEGNDYSRALTPEEFGAAYCRVLYPEQWVRELLPNSPTSEISAVVNAVKFTARLTSISDRGGCYPATEACSSCDSLVRRDGVMLREYTRSYRPDGVLVVCRECQKA